MWWVGIWAEVGRSILQLRVPSTGVTWQCPAGTGPVRGPPHPSGTHCWPQHPQGSGIKWGRAPSTGGLKLGGFPGPATLPSLPSLPAWLLLGCEGR